MKKISPIFILAILLLATACKKKNATPPPTSPVSFAGTTYRNVGTADDSGKPNNMTVDVVSANLSTFQSDNLPERIDLRKSKPELLSNPVIADIKVTSKSDIYITFVSQNTEFSNSIAYYTYPTNSPPASAKDIKEIVYVFPNAGNFTTLSKGDKIKIGTFELGTSVGFVLLKNAWNVSTKALNNQAVHFCSNDVLNPEFDPGLKKHAVLIKYEPENKVLIGFEDIDRTNVNCDHDFNDVVVYATVTPGS
ncbi:MAG: DUF4114 domain-containing protein [Pyrinomonadaceae bacterium]|nr:DUF4114 domain-containing protein [Sphingobacteriaceae bacterium]